MKEITRTVLRIKDFLETKAKPHILIEQLKRNTSLDLNGDIILIEEKKQLKPSDLANICNQYNADFLYLICKTVHYSGCKMCYGFIYDLENGKIKENRIIFTDNVFWVYNKTNASIRKEAISNLIILQSKKTMEEKETKRTERAILKDKIAQRYRLYKDGYIKEADEGKKQRFKWCLDGYDPKKISFSYNLTFKEIYEANKSYNYRTGYQTYKLDKSGYELTGKREDLQRKAKALKNKRINAKILTNKSIYINNIDKKIKKLENDIILKFQEVSAKNDIKLLINLVDFTKDKYNSEINDLKKYREKLLKFDESNIFYNPASFEEAIKEITEKEITIDTMLKDYNIYLNFKRLYKKIEEEQPREFFVNNGIKYPCLANAWKQRPFKIENNAIEVFGYSESIENYLQL